MILAKDTILNNVYRKKNIINKKPIQFLIPLRTSLANNNVIVKCKIIRLIDSSASKKIEVASMFFSGEYEFEDVDMDSDPDWKTIEALQKEASQTSEKMQNMQDVQSTDKKTKKPKKQRKTTASKQKKINDIIIVRKVRKQK